MLVLAWFCKKSCCLLSSDHEIHLLMRKVIALNQTRFPAFRHNLDLLHGIHLDCHIFHLSQSRALHHSGAHSPWKLAPRFNQLHLLLVACFSSFIPLQQNRSWMEQIIIRCMCSTNDILWPGWRWLLAVFRQECTRLFVDTRALEVHVAWCRLGNIWVVCESAVVLILCF